MVAGKMILKKNKKLLHKMFRYEQENLDWVISEVKDIYGIEEGSEDNWGFAQTNLLTAEQLEEISSVIIIEPVIISEPKSFPSLFELSGEL